MKEKDLCKGKADDADWVIANTDRPIVWGAYKKGKKALLGDCLLIFESWWTAVEKFGVKDYKVLKVQSSEAPGDGWIFIANTTETRIPTLFYRSNPVIDDSMLYWSKALADNNENK